MNKTLPDEVLYFTTMSLETKEMQRLKCHLQLHLGLGRLSASLHLHGKHKKEKEKKGEKKGERMEREKTGREERELKRRDWLILKIVSGEG